MKSSVLESACSSIRTWLAPLRAGARTTIWIEGSLILALGVLSVVEAWRLISDRDPTVLYDPLGPGWYIMVIGGCAILAGVTYIAASLWRVQESVEPKEPVSQRLLATIGLSFLYALSIYVVGYYVSTILFLIFQFRILGVEPWPKSAALGILTASVLWLIFVYYSNLIFPEGMMSFNW